METKRATHGGDPARHVGGDGLRKALDAVRPPADVGRLALIVARGPEEIRRLPSRATLTPEGGVPGDRWSDGDAAIEAQITLMNVEVARAFANGQELSLFGDNLLVDLDLSRGNLPAGSRLRVGEAELEVTDQPHTGCVKFRGRFGGDALRLTASPELRERRLRGIYARVIRAGSAAVGDEVTVLSRG